MPYARAADNNYTHCISRLTALFALVVGSNMQARAGTTPRRWGRGATANRWCTGATGPQVGGVAMIFECQAAAPGNGTMPTRLFRAAHPSQPPPHPPIPSSQLQSSCSPLPALQARCSCSARRTSSWATPPTWRPRSAAARRCGSAACSKRWAGGRRGCSVRQRYAGHPVMVSSRTALLRQGHRTTQQQLQYSSAALMHHQLAYVPCRRAPARATACLALPMRCCACTAAARPALLATSGCTAPASLRCSWTGEQCCRRGGGLLLCICWSHLLLDSS